MSLHNYWPTVEEVNNCIKSEAESVSDEVLIAVHQQFPLAYSIVGPDGKVIADKRSISTEDELLDHLLGSAPEGSLVVPITGASGIGKSHLIRLLDARIRHHPNAKRYLVIRIPKSASLRRVVELILATEPLRDAKFDGVKKEFSKALADLPLDQAVIRFQGQLEISLNDYARSLMQILQQNPTDSDTRERLNHAIKLPKLISDVETVGHFRSKVLPRIIQRPVAGMKLEGDQIKEADPTEGQFEAQDLDLQDVDFGQAAVQVANYYRTNLETFGGRGKVVAADVLNTVVDQATSQLYQLNQPLGGMTLVEVILEIRRLLLADNRDLVILVEDFKALVGIQDTLIKVLIQEGATSRGKEYATIRSAIAVTDGYLAGRDTLATRAGREWVVESRLESEEEVLRRTRLLVSSYLNAARYGETELKHHYKKICDEARGNGNSSSFPVYSDDSDNDEEPLKSFGYEGNVPLFPFTEAAIECLARSTLTSGNALVFNPRFIIKNVIREVLVAGREAFLNKKFPQVGFQVGGIGAAVSEWLASLAVSEDQRQQYRRLVTTWGNNPQSRNDIGRIPAKVFEVFGLPVPDIKFVKPPTKQVQSTSLITKTSDNVQMRAQVQQVEEFRNALENWVQEGVRLEQGIANKIRKALEALINARIDWNAERCLKQEIKSDMFSIPNAGGEQGLATDAIKIAPNNEDPDGRLRQELIALLRYYEVHKAKSEYEDIDEDFARVSNLLDRLLPAILEFVRSSAQRQCHAAILEMASNSRLLGISERGRTISTVSSFLFSEGVAIEELPDNTPQPFREWRLMQYTAHQIRPQLRQMLVATSGCFQGAGKTPNGVDIVRLVENYPAESIKMDHADLVNPTPELKQALQNISNVKVKVRINQVLQEARKITKSIQQELGDDFDKNKVLDVMKELANQLRERGAWSKDDLGFSPKDFEQLCEEFRSAAIKECLMLLQKLEDTDGEGALQIKKISYLAQLSFLPLIKTQCFLERAAKVLKSANKHSQTLTEQYKGVSPIEKATAIKSVFNNLLSDLLILKRGEE